MNKPPVLRPATKQDAAQLAVLMDIASRGLVSWPWTTHASAGRSPLEVGRVRIREREDLPSHYLRWTVVGIEQEIIGAFAGYVIPDPYNPGDVRELPEVYAPLPELESLAAGCWFLMALAVYPEFRVRGFGSAMLQTAISQARNGVSRRMAITVNSENKGALSLSLRAGFTEAARRHCVAFSGSSDSGDWILLTKELSS